MATNFASKYIGIVGYGFILTIIYCILIPTISITKSEHQISDIGSPRSLLPSPVLTKNYYVNLYPLQQSQTQFTVTLTSGTHSIKQYNYILFTSKNDNCINPSISFEFELIDYDESTEYLEISVGHQRGAGEIIKTCQGGSRQCDAWDLCLDRYNLGIDQISKDDTYELTVYETPFIEEACSDQYAVHAKLTMICDGPTTATTSTTTRSPSPSNNKIDCPDCDIYVMVVTVLAIVVILLIAVIIILFLVIYRKERHTLVKSDNSSIKRGENEILNTTTQQSNVSVDVFE